MKKVFSILCIIFLMVATMAGCSQQESGPAETNVIRVGIPGPYSGNAAIQGANLRYGVELAVEEINAAGGVNGMMIEPVYIDTENKVEVAVSAYQKLCTSDNVDIIVGEVSSSVALAVMDVIAKYQIPTIFAIPSSDELGMKVEDNPEKYGCIFMTDPPSSSMQDGVLTFLTEAVADGVIPAPNKTIAIIAEDSDWGKSTCAAWRSVLADSGWNIVVDEVMASGEIDFYPIFTRIANLKPDILKMEFTSVTSGSAATKQLSEMELDMIVFGGYYMKNAEFPHLAGEFAQYHMNIMEPVDPEFEEKITSKYSDATAVAACWSYDSIYIMKEAVERAGSLDNDALVAAIDETDYTGALMRTVYDPVTHFAMSGKEYKFYGAAQYIDNTLKTVYPYETAQIEFQLPPSFR
jgi:branched-chain amino acid transport system substrate-binding protein